MPASPIFPCEFPLCPRMQPCPVHRPRRTTVQQGYGSDHERLRIRCFERDQWRCVKCGWEPETVIDYRRFEMGTPPTVEVIEELRRRYNKRERHLHADHVIPVDARPDLRLDLGNMQTLCNLCHGRKTNEERSNGA